MIRVLVGDIFESKAQTLVNTVNTVGVMGKGVALAFKEHFPDMYEDYRKRCESGLVKLGKPYWVVAIPELMFNLLLPRKTETQRKGKGGQ